LGKDINKIMDHELVMQIPHKVVILSGIVECDLVKPNTEVVIAYEGQTIPARIMCLESFNKTYSEAVQGQEIALVFYPTKV
jgi:translation elongation factor EF-Tu-like GTPase